MSPRVDLRAYNPVEVPLEDASGKEHLFETVDLSQAESERAGELLETIQRMDDNAADEEAYKFLWEWFDLLLQPADDHKQKPSTVLKALLKAEKITPRQLMGLWIDLYSAIAKANAGPGDEFLVAPGENGTRPT